MLVIKNNTDGTLERIYIFDLLAHLGRAGTVIRPQFYYPLNLFDFYNEIETHLFEIGDKFSDVFKYVPQKFRALSIPPIISDFFRWSLSFSERGWLVDQSLIIGLTKGLEIDSRYIPANIQNVKEWATKLPHGPRFYLLQDLELDKSKGASWGLKISGDKFLDILGSELGKIVLKYIDSDLPIFIEINSLKAIKDFSRFISHFTPKDDFKSRIILYFSNDDFAQKLLPNIIDHKWIGVSTAGLSVETILQIVEFFKENNRDWSSRILFGTGYPFNTSKQISEAISYFLSKDFPGTLSDVRKILGANALSMLPAIYPFQNSVGKEVIFEITPIVYPVMRSELLKVAQNIDSNNLGKIVSIDFILSPNNNRVMHDSWIITLRLSRHSHISFVSVPYRSKQYIFTTYYNDIKSIGRNLKKIREYLSEKLKEQSVISIELPSNIFQFSKALIESIGVSKHKEVIRSNFVLMRDDINEKVLQISQEIGTKIGIENNDIGIIVNPQKEVWHALKTQYHTIKTESVVKVASDALDIFRMNEYDRVDLFKYEGTIRTAHGLLIAYLPHDTLLPTDLEDHILLHEEEIISQFKDLYIGNNMGFNLNISGVRLNLEIMRVTPPLENGEIAVFEFEDFKKVMFKPIQYFRDINLIFVVEDSQEAWTHKIQCSNLLFIKSLVRDKSILTELEKLKKFDDELPVFHASTLASIMTMMDLSQMDTQIKLAYTNATDTFDTFTVSYGDTSVQYIDLSDTAATGIIKSLISDIFYSMQHESDVHVDHMHLVDNLSSVIKTMPRNNETIVVLFMASIPEDISSFMEQINSLLSEKMKLLIVDLTEGKLPEIIPEHKGIQWRPHIFNFRTFRNKLIEILTAKGHNSL